MINADVVIVGGGPAGSSTAVTLARRGLHAVVLDKARFPRDKCCGDGLTASALRHLHALGLVESEVVSWNAVENIWLRSTSGRTAHLPLPSSRGSLAAVARRSDLDAALLERASRSGAEVLAGHALAGVRSAGESVEIEVDGIGTVTAPYVVGADGMWSPLRKALRLSDEGGYLGEWHAFRQYYRDVGPQARSGMWVWFERDLLPGYAWSFPLPDGRANVGLGLRRQPGRPTGEMKEIWSRVLEREHIRDVLGPVATPEAPQRSWPIPSRPARLTAAGGRILLVGDAARLADPLTGEGVGQALESGIIAASAVSTAGRGAPDVASRRYVEGVRRGLAIDNRLSAGLSWILSHEILERGAIRAADHNRWTRANFSRWMMEDYPRAAPLTPWRWRRGYPHYGFPTAR
jgi:geranylgeranyl reductase family protein